ncbi:MAG: hypothetical protein IPH07_34805 [Deltaproteobacteria bacterium]|nr:hypothetical protein [Deltaproteobacteria bacterium]MBK8716331.1 hypothetical protein [Deltaproteobacteria bacterium]MBP7291435.1 hypothetical protein [Nannocystaceae bacterium]
MSRRALAITVLALVPAHAIAAPTEPGTLVNPLNTTDECENCHLFPNPASMAAEPPFSPFRTWQGSMMANAGRDPVFWGAVAVAADDAPGETELCIRCHAPRAFLDGHGDVTSIDELTSDELSGVECEICHRAMEDLEAPVGNANYTIDDVFVDTNVPRRGPWDYSDGLLPPPHAWLYDPYIGSSRLCGTCHDVSTPLERVDDAGVGMGTPFNEQRTYSEWLNSDYAIEGPAFLSCQDCHMPEVDDIAACTQYQPVQSHPSGGRRHDLVGANRFVVSLLKQEYGSAGANVLPDSSFDNTMARYDDLLEGAASISILAPNTIDLEQGIADLGVRVANNTGHKLPSGYAEGRVAWLEMTAEYNGEVLYSSGSWDADNGLQRDGQIRTYEAIAEDFADGTELHLLRNNHWVLDNRIPPLGLIADPQTDPVGDRYQLQPGGTWPNFDDHSYVLEPMPQVVDATPDDPNDDLLVVHVRMRYLLNTPEYIEFLGDNGGAAGEHVAELFDLAGGATPETLGEQSISIPIVNFGAVAGTSTGTGTGEGTGTSTTGGSTGGSTTGVADTSVGATTLGESSTTLAADGSTSSGGPTGTDGGGGCACVVGPRDRGLVGAPWLLALALVRRRRGRR